MKTLLFALATTAAFAAPPVINELQPRGAQKGRPFTLTIVGRELNEGTKIWSTMPASFTPMAPEKTGPMLEGRYASFLVEPKEELAVGVYPIRVTTPDGISNIQFFAVGSFPEIAEEESRAGALPNSNDSVENAQSLPSTPVTLNGMLRGAERDVFRVSGKAGEKRVFEVEARRVGSAIDPVVRVLDASGRMIARSEDTPLLGLDSRVEVTFPREGYYYVELHDARYSTQPANYYRLKTGAYPYPKEIFPLGGQRGKQVAVSFSATQKVMADLSKVGAKEKQIFVNLPDSPSLPVPFAVGDDPEMTEPVTAALAVPVTVNGKVSQPAEIDKYQFQVSPGDAVTLRVEARELGTSKLMAVITVYDEKGTKIGRSGDEPLAEDFFNVNQSRTAGDPMLRLDVPEGVKTLTVTVEDLALRGGPGYAYRLNAQKLAQDFKITLNVPYVNVPQGGSVAVPVTVERRGFDGDVQLRVANAPKGLKVEGGYVVAGAPVKENARNRNSRGVLVVSSEPGVSVGPLELSIEGVGKLPDGQEIVRKAEGPGIVVGVNGATLQGSVDRQRPLTAYWLNLDLPAATTEPPPATVEVSLLGRRRMEEGDELKFRWKFTGKQENLPYPKAVTADMVGAGDVRVIDARQDPKDPSTGTFLMTTTKLTRPSKYDVIVTGRILRNGQTDEIVSRPIQIEIEEVKSANVAASGSGR